MGSGEDGTRGAVRRYIYVNIYLYLELESGSCEPSRKVLTIKRRCSPGTKLTLLIAGLAPASDNRGRKSLGGAAWNFYSDNPSCEIPKPRVIEDRRPRLRRPLYDPFYVYIYIREETAGAKLYCNPVNFGFAGSRLQLLVNIYIRIKIALLSEILRTDARLRIGYRANKDFYFRIIERFRKAEY